MPDKLTVIAVSQAADARFSLVVVAVDLEVRLYDDVGVEVFSARKVAVPVEHPLRRNAGYYLRYNNNDGGDGILHFRVIETRNQKCARYEIHRSAIDSPEVIELRFRLEPDVLLAQPA